MDPKKQVFDIAAPAQIPFRFRAKQHELSIVFWNVARAASRSPRTTSRPSAF